MPADENLPAFFGETKEAETVFDFIACKLLKQGLNYFQASFYVLSFLSLSKKK